MLNLVLNMASWTWRSSQPEPGGYQSLEPNASMHPVGVLQIRSRPLSDVIHSKETAGRNKDLRGATGAPPAGTQRTEPSAVKGRTTRQ